MTTTNEFTKGSLVLSCHFYGRVVHATKTAVKFEVLGGAYGWPDVAGKVYTATRRKSGRFEIKTTEQARGVVRPATEEELARWKEVRGL